MFYMILIVANPVGFLIVPFGIFALLILRITGLPVPVFMIFYNAYLPFVVYLIGFLGITFSLVALLRIKIQKIWSWVFIALSILAYAISVLNLARPCTIAVGDSGVVESCGLSSWTALPNFFSSTVLLASALIIHYYIRKSRELVSTDDMNA